MEIEESDGNLRNIISFPLGHTNYIQRMSDPLMGQNYVLQEKKTDYSAIFYFFLRHGRFFSDIQYFFIYAHHEISVICLKCSKFSMTWSTFPTFFFFPPKELNRQFLFFFLRHDIKWPVGIRHTLNIISVALPEITSNL